jgi:vacuolar-type H+-ATPase subunit E/Vma4
MRRLVLLPLAAFLFLASCKRETSEAVAEAKGAAADAKRAAEDARRAADNAAAQAKTQAQATATDATAKVHEMGQAVQQGVNDATTQAKAGVENAGQKVQQGVNAAGQSIREVGQGNVITGKLTSSSPKQVVVLAPSDAVVTVAADDQTRWVSKGGIGAREGVPVSSSVRVTYIVRDGQKVATQVEQLP